MISDLPLPLIIVCGMKTACVHRVLSLSCSFYRYPELVLDLIAYHNPYVYAMVSFSTGYCASVC